MFFSTFLIFQLFDTVAGYCTPFLDCNQPVMGDFVDEQQKGVILMGRPFRNSDEIVITGRFKVSNNETTDEAAASVFIGLGKGAVMEQTDEATAQQILLLNITHGSETILASGNFDSSRNGNETLLTLQNPVDYCDFEEFTFRIKSMDGCGVEIGNETTIVDQVPFNLDLADNEVPLTFWIRGNFETTSIHLICENGNSSLD